MRKTKIVCTIGPACSDEQTLSAMCLAGMNVARLNFSHGSHEEHRQRVELIKRVREKLSLPIAILLDTKGPEYRIGTFSGGRAQLKAGQRFTFMRTAARGTSRAPRSASGISRMSSVPGTPSLSATASSGSRCVR